MKTPDWNDLRYFLAVIEAGSLSGAARQLGVEHTTVARRIDALETVLELRLFDRFAKGWAVTAAGTKLVPPARTVGADVDALLRAATGATELRGKVRVSGTPAIIAYVVAPRLKDAMTGLAEVEVELGAESQNVDLMRREADIALRMSRPSAPGLATRVLTTLHYSLYASAAYLAERDPAQWEFISYDEAPPLAPQQQWLDKVAAGRRHVLRTNDLGTQYQAVLAGLGVAVLPDYFAQQPLPIVRIDGYACPVKRKVWIVMHEDVRRAPRVRAVADRLIAMFDDGRAHEATQ